MNNEPKNMDRWPKGFEWGPLSVSVGGMWSLRGRRWYQDGLHIWWGRRGVHLFWQSTEHEPRRVIFEKADR